MKSTIELFIENDDAMKSPFKWENSLIRKCSAFQLAIHQQTVQIDQIKEIMQYIKQHTSALSYFRNNNLLFMATALSCHEHSHQVFDLTIQYYDELKKAGFQRSVYLPYVAYFLATEVEPNAVQPTIEKAHAIFSQMKKDHFWLTSTNDHILSIILAYNAPESASSISKEMEECYSYLHTEGMSKGNSLQSICQLLALSTESVVEKCNRVITYEQIFKQRKLKLDSYTRVLLANLALTKSEHENAIIDQIILTDNELATQDGFGNWSLGKNRRMMFSIALVSSYYLQIHEQQAVNASLQNSLQSLLLAQQVAMIAVLTAAAASSASSSSSS